MLPMFLSGFESEGHPAGDEKMKHPMNSRFRQLLLTLCSLLTLAAIPVPLHSQSPAPGLQLRHDPVTGWKRIKSEGMTNRVHTLESSTDLVNWSPAAVLQDSAFDFADPRSESEPRLYYRSTSRVRSSSDDFKNQIQLPSDRFLTGDAGMNQTTLWVKFAILLDDPNRVWFQDGGRYAFHYDFAVRRLPRFAGMTRAQFDAVSLRREGQQVVLGAVILPADPANQEFGIQFVGRDPYPPELLLAWFKRVEAAVLSPTRARGLYLPAWEQTPDLPTRAALEKAGIQTASVDRWTSNSICYSDGWALGRLVYVPAAEIESAHATGRLKFTDILLTDGIPAEIPHLAGIITLVPATPNSHVAILARSYRIPFVYAAQKSEREALQAAVGREVLVRVWTRFLCELRVTPVGQDFSPDLRAEILALKSPGPARITPRQRLGMISTNTAQLTPADIRHVGGKAANFGILRRSLPTNSPVAIAFTFDLWDAFLDQHLPKYGRSLRQEIAARTEGFSHPPDVARVHAALDQIRDMIRNEATFTREQESQILEAIAQFEPGRKIRFRSSTNVEDSEQFTGAGLYDSYSGCPADDLDADNSGPSACDAEENSERGVFRAMRRVYASFYNNNAWLERLRYGLKEEDLGMGILAHYSYPDEDELANGVATLDYSRTGNTRSYVTHLTTQLGALSVSNPDGSATAETVDVYQFGSSASAATRTRSSLVPLGGNVLQWDAEYLALSRLLNRVADAYAALDSRRTDFTLDLEYKKVRPGFFSVKQVRLLPTGGPAKSESLWLINEPAQFTVLQGEHADIFAIHRLKCLLNLESRNTSLNPTNLSGSLFTNATIEFLFGGESVRMTNGISSWPGAEQRTTSDRAFDSWYFPATGSSSNLYTLESSIARPFDADTIPFITTGEMDLTLSANYSTPQPSLDFNGPTNITSESVRLTRTVQVNARSILQNRVIGSKGRIQVQTSFYWPEPPSGPSAGYTAPLIAWVRTTITGLISTPIVLTSDWSQSYQPGHHNFWENFLFEPRLEPGINEAQLAELREKNIQMLLVEKGDFSEQMQIVGLDGKFRKAQ